MTHYRCAIEFEYEVLRKKITWFFFLKNPVCVRCILYVCILVVFMVLVVVVVPQRYANGLSRRGKPCILRTWVRANGTHVYTRQCSMYTRTAGGEPGDGINPAAFRITPITHKRVSTKQRERCADSCTLFLFCRYDLTNYRYDLSLMS